MSASDEGFLTTKETCQFLEKAGIKLSPEAVRILAYGGAFVGSRKDSNGHWQISKSAVQKYIRQQNWRRYSIWTFVSGIILLLGLISITNDFFGLQDRFILDSPYDQYLAEGQELLSLDNFEEAEQNFREATKLRPDDASAWYWIAETTARQEHLRNAQAFVETALQHDPNHVPSLMLQTALYLSLGNTESAHNIMTEHHEISDFAAWSECINKHGFFNQIVTTLTSLDATCPRFK